MNLKVRQKLGNRKYPGENELKRAPENMQSNNWGEFLLYLVFYLREFFFRGIYFYACVLFFFFLVVVRGNGSQDSLSSNIELHNYQWKILNQSWFKWVCRIIVYFYDDSCRLDNYVRFGLEKENGQWNEFFLFCYQCIVFGRRFEYWMDKF